MMENSRAQIEAETEERFSVFEIAKWQFGISVLHVKEIINLTNITRLPNAPPFLYGIINLRGKIISVIDLVKLFDLNQQDLGKYTGMIVFDTGSGLFSVFYEHMHDFIKISRSRLPDSSKKIPDTIVPYLYGVYNEVLLLNGENLFNGIEVHKV